MSAPEGESSSIVRARILKARARQRARFEQFSSELSVNAHASGKILDEITALKPEAKDLLTRAAHKMNLSARAWHRVLKVARTIADLAGDVDILETHHVAEALSYRRIKFQD